MKEMTNNNNVWKWPINVMIIMCIINDNEYYYY